jgi:hypothetical protein
MAKDKIQGKERTYHDVIKSFEGLGCLPITGDSQEVKARIQKNYRGQQQLSQKVNVESERQSAAKEWIAHYTLINNNFKEVMDLLKDSSFETCDSKLLILRSESADNKYLNGHLLDSLKDVVVGMLKVTPELADKFVESWMKDRGWTKGGVLDKPEPVSDLKVMVDGESILVKWSRPSHGCDAVRLTRINGQGEKQLLKDCSGASHPDSSNLKPGEKYHYEAVTVFAGKLTTCSEVSHAVMVPQVQPVTNVKAVLADKSIEVAWRIPTQGYAKAEVTRVDLSSKARKTFEHEGNAPFRDPGPLNLGHDYVYEVRSCYMRNYAPDVVKSDPVTLPAKARVTDQPKLVGKGKIEFSYANALGSTSTHFYRGDNVSPLSGVPAMKAGSRLPPGIIKCPMVTGSPHAEIGLKDGVAYQFLLVPIYNGIPHYDYATETATTLIPQTAQVPSESKGEYDSIHNSIRITWEHADNCQEGDEYFVRELKANALGAPVPKADEKGWTALRYADISSPPTGRNLRYALFAKRGTAVSSESKLTNYIWTLRDVWNTNVECEDGGIKMTWASSPEASEVQVTRVKPQPTSSASTDQQDDGHRSGYKESQLTNGLTHSYFIQCKYLVTGEKASLSKGVMLSGVPFRVPQPPSSFKIDLSRDRESIVIRGASSQQDQFAVIRSMSSLRRKIGHMMSISDLPSDAKLITCDDGLNSGGDHIVLKPSEKSRCFTAVTHSPPHVILGEEKMLDVRLKWHLKRTFVFPHFMKKLFGKVEHWRPATHLVASVEGDPRGIRKLLLVGRINCIPEGMSKDDLVLVNYTPNEEEEWRDGTELELPINCRIPFADGRIHCRLFVECCYHWESDGEYMTAGDSYATL